MHRIYPYAVDNFRSVVRVVRLKLACRGKKTKISRYKMSTLLRSCVLYFSPLYYNTGAYYRLVPVQLYFNTDRSVSVSKWCLLPLSFCTCEFCCSRRSVFSFSTLKVVHTSTTSCIKMNLSCSFGRYKHHRASSWSCEFGRTNKETSGAVVAS